MAIEAPLSKFKKNNIIIFIVVLLGAAVWLGYDGYFNEKFKEKNTEEDGSPNHTLVVNRKSPPYLAGGAIALGIYLALIRGRKIVAEENELILSDGKKISYDSIERIDKTYFDKKGYFVIGYKDPSGNDADLKISDRQYDNLAAILELLVSKIS